jgi:HSP20 family molecular chaperone IbpA
MNTNNLNEAASTATAISHQLIDNFRDIGHDLINTAVGLSVPIINNMAQTNINIPKQLDAIKYYKKTLENKILIMCELPGASKKSMNLIYSNDILKVSGHTKWDDEWLLMADKKYYIEINVGDIDKEKIQATLEHGVLRITLIKNCVENVESIIEIN